MGSLETVVAALAASGEEREREHADISFVLLNPTWNAGISEGKLPEDDPATRTSISRLSITGKALRKNARSEEPLISALKTHTDPSSAPAAVNLLKAHLNSLRTFGVKRADHDGFSTRITNAAPNPDLELRDLLKTKSGSLSRRLITEILCWCLRIQFWDPVYALAVSGCVSANELPGLVDSIVELGDVKLVSLFIFCVPDIRPGQWLRILKLFLAHPAKSQASLRTMKKIFRGLINEYLESTAKKSEAPSEVAACVHLAAAYDGFSASELCLHFFLAAKQDKAVLEWILGELEGGEVAELLVYLNKWLKKFSDRLIHVGEVKRDERKLVPSLSLVVRCVEGLLDGRYSSAVLDQSLSRELAVTRKLVDSFVSVGKKAGSLEAVVQHLLAKKPLPSDKPGSEGAEHIIEYFEYS